MAKYRKKPIVIEAEVYREGLEDGFDCRTMFCAYSGPAFCTNQCGHGKPYIDARHYTDTLAGKHYISPGDYIITDINGERYPCKPDIFEKAYELVIESI